MRDSGTIWVIDSYHNIYRAGAIMQDLGTGSCMISSGSRQTQCPTSIDDLRQALREKMREEKKGEQKNDKST